MKLVDLNHPGKLRVIQAPLAELLLVQAAVTIGVQGPEDGLRLGLGCLLQNIILNYFSRQIDPKMPDCINQETIKEKMVFPMKDIVRYYAVDVDLNFATKEEFQTDTQISNK